LALRPFLLLVLLLAADMNRASQASEGAGATAAAATWPLRLRLFAPPAFWLLLLLLLS